MPAWLLRGLCMGLLHAIGVTALAKYRTFHQIDIGTAQVVAIALLVGVAAAWGAIDAWLSRRDRGRNWFIAGLISGPVAGILGVVGRAVLVDQTGIGALGDALTGGAAFTALLVIVPAGLGVFAGGLLFGRNRDRDSTGDDEPPRPQSRHRRGTVARPRRATITARKRAGRENLPPSPTPRPRS